jgi:IS4 transposase
MTGLRFVDMDEEKLRKIVQEEFRSEITRAFKEVGLHDDDAPGDVRDLRELLRTYKQAQSTVIKTILTFMTLGLLSFISLGFYNRMNGGGE